MIKKWNKIEIAWQKKNSNTDAENILTGLLIKQLFVRTISNLFQTRLIARPFLNFIYSKTAIPKGTFAEVEHTYSCPFELLHRLFFQVISWVKDPKEDLYWDSW